MIYVILVLVLLAPGDLLYIPLFLLISYKVYLRDVLFLLFLCIGTIVTLFHYINGSGDLKLIMPFILLGALLTRENNEYNKGKLQILFYAWSIISIVFAFLYGFNFISTDNALVQYYWSMDADRFKYDSDDIQTFRLGSFYFNPNQYSYMALIFLLSLGIIGGFNWYIFLIYILLLFMTQSRMFILIAIAFYPLLKGHSLKSFSFFLVVLGLVFLSMVVNYLGETRLFALKEDYISHGLYKFGLLDGLFNRSLIEQFTGSGNTTMVVGYDADMGYVMQYYGWPIGFTIFITYLFLLYKKMPFVIASLFLLASLYGTILVNTRLALFMAVLCAVSNQNLKIVKSRG